MKNIRIPILILFIAASVVDVRFARGGVDSTASGETQPKNVILFVADGAGPAYFTMARDYQRRLIGRETLFIDDYLTGSVRTYSSNQRVTDSAAGATAYAAGVKTYNGAIGVDSLRRPVGTVLEAAEEQGRLTGMVATSRITHATPAAFSAHVPTRGMEDEIAAQQITQGIDVIIGGGLDHFLPDAVGGKRSDRRDLVREAERLGYHVATGLLQLREADQLPLFALLTMNHMTYEIERDSLQEPSLAEMTAKAIELLGHSSDGFFLLVEASRIDHAGHNNDAPTSVREMIAYDEAFKVAVDFSVQDGETLVIATADHETGGLSVGRDLPPDTVGSQAGTYWRSLVGRHQYEWDPTILAVVRATVGSIADELKQPGAAVDTVLRELAGIDDLQAGERRAIETARGGFGDLQMVVSEIIARRAGLGWTTGGHTAVDVGLYAFGPGSERFRGHVDNTHIGRELLKIFGSDVTVLEDTQ